MTELQKKIKDLEEHALTLEIEADRCFIMSQYERGNLLMSRRNTIIEDVERMKAEAGHGNR